MDPYILKFKQVEYPTIIELQSYNGLANTKTFYVH